jgi:zinc transport system substrate-binding protein
LIPSPKEVRALNNSSVLFAIGHGLDNWAFKIAESAGIEEIYIVDKGIDLLDSEEHEDEDEDEDEHEEYENDPHYWLSVKNALIIAEQVKDELSNKFPEKNNVFEENFENYSKKLETLDQEMKTKLTLLKNPSIGTFHNAWSYFARDYPVTIAAVFEEFPGKEPTAKYISGFQEKVRSNNVRVIFAEPQFSPIALEPIAKDLGIKLSVLDPLGGSEGKDTYEALMVYNVNQIIKAFE